MMEKAATSHSLIPVLRTQAACHAPALPFLIPVLVTGIQQRRVGGAKESFHAKDFASLDFCDEHRNEVEN